jgi:hypothetical protein
MSFFVTHAANQHEAKKQSRGCTLSDHVVSAMWADPDGRELPAPQSAAGTVRIGIFPYLSRMADPYRNYTYQVGELPALRAEVVRVASHRTLSQEVRSAVQQLAALIREAEAEGHCLFCFGD